MLKGGESGPAIVPGDPDASLLIKAVRHAPGVSKMPRSAAEAVGRSDRCARRMDPDGRAVARRVDR